MAMTLEQFTERFNDLSTSEKVSIYNEYQLEHGDPDDTLHEFNEEFFDLYFEGKPMEAARAASFGEINWNDEYIHFNGYGNLESASESEADAIIEDEIEEIFEEIFEHPDVWEDYIEEEEEDTEEE